MVVPDVRRLRRDVQDGATAVEYAIMVALIAVVVIAAVAFVGLNLKSDFDCAGSWVDEMPDDPGCTT